MPIQPIISGSDVISPSDSLPAQPRGFWENVGTGVSHGWNETTLAYAGDIVLQQESEAGIRTQLTEEEYMNHINRVPGVAYDPLYTEEIMARVSDTYTAQANWTDAASKTTGGWSGGLFAGALIGAIPDPINLIPVAGGAGWLARAGKMGLTAAAAEVALTPLAYQAYKSRGVDYTTEMALTNIAFAFTVGSVLQVGIDGVGTGLKSAARSMGYGERTLANELIDGYSEQYGVKINLDPTTQTLINRRELNFITHDKNNIRNQNIYNPDKELFVDTRGKIYNNANDISEGQKYVKIFYSVADNTLVLQGDNKSIVKIGKTLINEAGDFNNQVLPDNVRFKIISEIGDELKTSLDAKDFNSWINNQSSLYNRSTIYQNLKKANLKDAWGEFKNKETFTAELDTDWAFTTKDKKFEIQIGETGFDANDPTVGRLYELSETGRKEITDPAQRTKIYNELFARSEADRVKSLVAGVNQTVKKIKSSADELSEKSPSSREEIERLKGSNNVNPSNEVEFISTATENKIRSEPDPEIKIKILEDAHNERIVELETMLIKAMNLDPKIRLWTKNKDGQLVYKDGTLLKLDPTMEVSSAHMETQVKKRIDAINELTERKKIAEIEKEYEACRSRANTLLTAGE